MTFDVTAFAQAFRGVYDGSPRVWSAPGRVNLIGEHTDYNDGFVLPLAINLRTWVAGARRSDRLVRARSLNLDEAEEVHLDDEDGGGRRTSWFAYVEGVARVLERRGARLAGADLLISSEVPMGAGLSSSAALEVAAGQALADLSNAAVSLKELALAAQEAEHVYAGTRCGVMDQLTAAFGKKGHALLIDCRTTEASPIGLRLADSAIVVCDTGVKHKLAASAYNTRRAECEQSVELLREALLGIQALRDVSAEDFQTHQSLLPDVLRRRARHVVTENARTLAAAAALRAGDVREFGRLMRQSHESLRDDYEVSSPELDLMVNLASNVDGVRGARMTGGGFGGATVNLVRRDALDVFRERIAREYQQKVGVLPAIHVVEASNGVNEILLSQNRPPQ